VAYVEYALSLVHPRPIVSVVPTGDEVRPPSAALGQGAAGGLGDPDHSGLLVVVVRRVVVVVRALTGLLGWLSTAWLTVVPTAAGSGA
jgi:hypothetical protein